MLDLITKEKEDSVFIQGRIPKSLFKEISKILEERNLSWSKYLIAVTNHFLDGVIPGRIEKRKRDA